MNFINNPIYVLGILCFMVVIAVYAGKLVFILNKIFMRPWILENEVLEILLMVSFSIPNFIEAIVGTLILTGILFQVRQYFNGKLDTVNDTVLHILAVSIASIYVISQELKFHYIGGNNVYDPYDIAASLMGLIMTFGVIKIFGFVETKF